eukprot:TRINITY_DN46084_c0_g1_i1.p1 TRINITY_DN46084_c0_g1~~TRINITY_DN46084_c0_g1_i1.p1  ORF type:complete len:235 (+),score=47.22 TRINITY_DN46084_c0_g1_i1:123-827(+)
MAAWLSSPTGPMTTHFWGPIANWGLSLSAIYDATTLGPEVINERMSATQVVYSGLFMRFAWMVQPRNYILFTCHTANVGAQSNQLRRWAEHKLEVEPQTAPAKLQELGTIAGCSAAGLAGILLARKPIMSGLAGASFLPAAVTNVATHPAGPFYIHFWAPNFKWALSINNLLDYNRPTDKISVSMNSALTLTGLIFMRWSFVITPVNYSLFFVNLALASSSGYHLGRKLKADYM